MNSDTRHIKIGKLKKIHPNKTESKQWENSLKKNEKYAKMLKKVKHSRKKGKHSKKDTHTQILGHMYTLGCIGGIENGKSKKRKTK